MEKVANKAEAQVKAQKNEHAADKDAEFKAKKAEAAKRFAENQKARKEAMKKLAEEIKTKNLLDKLSPEGQKFINDVLNPAVRTGFGGQSFFNKVFGDAPKAGDKITLLDYLTKTLQAKAKLDKEIKAWAEKGIVVTFTEDPDPRKAVYTITKM